MRSNVGIETEGMLADLREKLKVWNEAYEEAEAARLDTTDYPELADFSEVVTKAQNIHARQCGIIEDIISKQESLWDLLNTELLDGRTVDDVFAEFEQVVEDVDGLSLQYESYEDELQEASRELRRLSENVSKIALAKAAVEHTVKTKLDSSIVGNP